MGRQTEYLVELKTVIEQKYRCKATHRETVFVQEKTKKNETVWNGYVEIFDLTGHEEAKTCYAWQNIAPNDIKIFAVLGSHLVDSPQRAIQAAIFVDAQPAASKFAGDLETLKKRIEAGKKALYESELLAEDLDAAIQASQNKREYRQNRKRPT